MTKILLVRPPELREASFAQFYTLHEALGIGYLAAYLRAHQYPVTLLDAQVEGLTIQGTIESIKLLDFDLLGLSVISPLAFPPALEIIRAIKTIRPEVHVTIGGQHPTFFYKNLLNRHLEIDTVVRFEGEETLLELVANLGNPESWHNILGIAFRDQDRVVATPLRPLIADLDSLPFPARDALPRLLERGGLPAILTSRGCPGRCTFCSVCAFYKAPPGKVFRTRSPKNTMQEIKDLVERLSCNELWFVDDNFLVPARRVRDLFKLMDQENLTLKRFDFSCRSDCVVHDPSLIELAAKHGAKIIYLGVEAGVQRHLDLYHKGTTVSQNRDAIRIIKEAEADIKMEFIFFNPWITFEEIKETIAFLEDVKVYDPYILTSILSLTRHTPLGEDVEAGRRKIIQTSPNDLQDFDFEAFIPYKISDERARMVFYIVSQVLVQFEPALYAVYRLFNLLRKDRKRLPEDLARHYEGLIHDFQQLINETSLDIFKETITWVENLGKPESVESFRYDLTCKTLRFAEFLANQAIQPQEKEFIRAINESGTASF